MKVQNYGHIKSIDELHRYVEWLNKKDDPIGFDIETGYWGLDREKGAVQPHIEDSFIVGFSLTRDSRAARYVPLGHDYGPNLDPDEVWPIVKPTLEQTRIIAHNAKFEKRFCRTVDIELGIVGDSMLQAYVAAEFPEVGLKYMVERIFGHKMKEFKDLFPGISDADLKKVRFNTVEMTPEVVSYACEDAAWCLALHDRLNEYLVAQLPGVYRLELLIMEILCDMEDWGVSVDWPGIKGTREQIEPFLYHLKNELREVLSARVGRDLSDLNFGSPKQLREVLFDDMGLKPAKYTDKGAASTDNISLTKLSKQDEMVKQLLELREVENLHKRLIAWLDERPDKPRTRGSDGKVHASYSQTVVPTGRFSASEPAIQQLPKDWSWTLLDGSEFAGNYRDFLVPTPGRYFIGFDYSQIELRVIAGLAGEKQLLEAFKNGDDVHTLTAARMLGIRVEDVDPKKDRPIGKTMNFALIYGMGVKSLAARLGLSDERAQELYDNYFAQFPAITAWMAKARMLGGKHGYTESWLGRRAKVWAALATDHKTQSKAPRIYGNYPVQGGAADYMKLAMVKVMRKLKEENLWGNGVWMLMNQHDALEFEVDESLDPHYIMDMLRPVVEFDVPIFPPIESDWEFGYRYGSCWKFLPDMEVEKTEEGHWHPVGDAELSEHEIYLAPTGSDAVADMEGVLEMLDLEEEETDAQESLSMGRTIIVELEDMPTATGYPRFVEYLKSKPGFNTVIVRTPQGDVTPMKDGCGAELEDSARFKLYLGACKVYYPEEEISGYGLDLSHSAEVSST